MAARDITDKIFRLVEEQKKRRYQNAIQFAQGIANEKLEEFSYIRDDQVQYSDWGTIRDYIFYASDLTVFNKNFSLPDGANFSDRRGFNSWLGDLLLTYLDNNNLDIQVIQSTSEDLIKRNILPTTDKMYEAMNTKMSNSHFKWSLNLLQILKPLTITVCRKWIWVPSKSFEF